MFKRVNLALTRIIKYNKNVGFCKSAQNKTSEIESPLEGVRILDLTRIVAGPYCTMILGDLGAEILKIEHPDGGDEARRWGPPFVNGTSESAYFVTFNRNKKSVCVNLKSAKGRDIIYDLAEKCDVLIENYVPGKLDKLKLGYDDFKFRTPRLIYCSITGYGSEGPYKNKPGYDVIAASVGGLLHITGPKNGEPVKVGVAITDLATGLYAHGAILAALIKRSKTGCGQKIDCDLLSTQLSTLINIGSNYLNAGIEAKRMGTEHASLVPYMAVPAKDGYFTIGAGSDRLFIELCNKLGCPDVAKDPKYLTNKDRVENSDSLNEILKSIIKTKTKKELTEIFEGSSIPCGPVNTLREVFDDPHVKFIDIVKTVKHPLAGDVKLVGPPVKYSEGGNKIRSAPPSLGQHTDEVLKGILNYDDDELGSLRANKTVPRVTLKLRKPRTDRKVQWSTETVDNENMNKKKSKCCCIFEKPRKFGESSSEDSSDDECEHCKGHVEKKKKHRKCSTDGTEVRPEPSHSLVLTE